MHIVRLIVATGWADITQAASMVLGFPLRRSSDLGEYSISNLIPIGPTDR